MAEKILIVSRPNLHINTLQKYLSDHYEVTWAGSFFSALDMYYQLIPEVVIIEDFLPGQSGLELCKAIKQEANKVEIVLLVHPDFTDRTSAKIKSDADCIVDYPQHEKEIEGILALPLFGEWKEGAQKRAAQSENSQKVVLNGFIAEESGVFDSIGDYQLLGKIAEGGMADIYLALKRGYSGFRKLLVLKLINRVFSRSEDFVKRFMDEAKIGAYLNHKNIVQVYDHGIHDNQLYITMEYVKGSTLSHLIQHNQSNAIPAPIVAYVAQEICYGLSYAHNAIDDRGRRLQIIHRDLSPHNILLSSQGEVKIADFGVAKAAISHHHTEETALVGKLLYMAPEQIKNEPSQASDIFALGVILYEMLSYQHPYVARDHYSSPVDIIKAISKSSYRGLSTSSIEEKELERVIRRALSKELDQRYHTAEEMLSDLLRFQWGAHQKSHREYMRQYAI